MKPILKRGDQNHHVSEVKVLMRSQGFWDGTDSQDFGPKMKAAVTYFQSTHLGPDGKFLKGDGEIGPRTWWALENPSGDAQRSFIQAPTGTIPALTSNRSKLIEILLAEHRAGVREVPDGSNGGDGVEKFIAGVGRVAWCALTQSWVHREVFGSYPNGTRYAHVQTWWREARQNGTGFLKSQYVPVPGDLAVWCFAGGTGHISRVVAVSPDDRLITNCVGGNEGNRLKLGVRDFNNEPRMVGFINNFGDTKTGRDITFNRGLFTSGSEGPLGQGGTR